MAWFHHYNITWNIFTALKILCALPLHSSFHTVVTTDLTVSMVFSFPKMSYGKIIQYVSFLDWLLLFSHVHLSFPHVFSCFGSSFLFSAE